LTNDQLEGTFGIIPAREKFLTNLLTLNFYPTFKVMRGGHVGYMRTMPYRSIKRTNRLKNIPCLLGLAHKNISGGNYEKANGYYR
jgi:hypothetical protein